MAEQRQDVGNRNRDKPGKFPIPALGGPDSERYLLGARLLEAFPLLPLVPDQALRLAAYSYRGRLHWGFSADWDLLPDLHDLVQFTEEAFRELCESAPSAAA